jgi:hypothetical protein
LYIPGIYQVYTASRNIHGIYMVYTDYIPSRGSRCSESQPERLGRAGTSGGNWRGAPAAGRLRHRHRSSGSSLAVLLQRSQQRAIGHGGAEPPCLEPFLLVLPKGLTAVWGHTMGEPTPRGDMLRCAGGLGASQAPHVGRPPGCRAGRLAAVRVRPTLSRGSPGSADPR